MGRKLTDTSFAPTAQLRVKDAMLQGVLGAKRLVATTYGNRAVYSLVVEDANCEFVREKAPVDIEVGTTVDLFAPTKLDRQLSQAKQGDRVKILYLGLGKAGRKGSNPPHLFDVELL